MSLVSVPIYSTRNKATTVDNEARKLVSGNGVTVVTNPDGSISIDISGALGPYVLKAGDTMTGKLSIDGGATGIGGGQLNLRNTATYQFDIGMGSAGPTSTDAFLANRHASGSISFFTGSPTTRRGIVTSAGAWTFTGSTTINCATNTNDVFAVLQPGTSPAGSFVQISSPASVPGIIAQYDNTKRRDIRFANAGIEFGASVNTGGPGIQFTVLDTGQIGLAQTATTPYFIGPWPGNAAYTSIRTAAMTGNEYLMLATDTAGPDTFISAKTSGSVYLRANANGTPGQVRVSTAGLEANGTIIDVYGNVRDIPLILNASGGASPSAQGRCYAKTNNTAATITIQPNATTAIPTGTAITFMNMGGTSNNLTVARGAGVAIYRSGTNADIILTPGNSVTLLKLATDVWQA